jgi:hypothetical protein
MARLSLREMTERLVSHQDRARFTLRNLAVLDCSRPPPPMLSRDGSTFMFSSQRPGGIAAYDLWTNSRACVVP